MDVIRVKRGDTVSIAGARTDAAGDPVSLVGVTITAQMRRGDVAIDLTPTVTDAAGGLFTVGASAATSEDWALGVYECDIQFSGSGVVESTETFVVNVVEDITRAG